ncbi:MAG: HD-GYP domain-containing protein [Massilimicrobiota timonensis]
MIRDFVYQRLESMINTVPTEHSQSLNQYAKDFIKGIQEKCDVTMSHVFIENFPMIVTIHDIGKKHIPDYILEKTTQLTDDEYECVKRHCILGYEDLQKAFNNIPLNEEERELIELCKESCLYHHERLDGSGYPYGYKQIPLIAQMVGILDSFDAMAVNRCYKKAMSKEEAIKKLIQSDKYNEEFIYVLSEVIENENEIRNSDK